MLPYLEITHSQDLSAWAGEERSKSNMAESKDITDQRNYCCCFSKPTHSTYLKYYMLIYKERRKAFHEYQIYVCVCVICQIVGGCPVCTVQCALSHCALCTVHLLTVHLLQTPFMKPESSSVGVIPSPTARFDFLLSIRSRYLSLCVCWISLMGKNNLYSLRGTRTAVRGCLLFPPHHLSSQLPLYSPPLTFCFPAFSLS